MSIELSMWIEWCVVEVTSAGVCGGWPWAPVLLVPHQQLVDGDVQ
jgi:hypothetical protein